MGRKPLSDARKTETPLRIRLDESERSIIDKAAAAAELPTSTWARTLLIRAAEKSQTQAAKQARKK